MNAFGDLTPTGAPILCLVCTPSACGSQLIATIIVTLGTSLADVRSMLLSLASGGDGGPAAVKAAPVNVSVVQAQTIITSPLHPFDFKDTFSFVYGGGCRAYAHAEEASLHVEDVLPRYPRFGVPSGCTSPSARLTSSTDVTGASLTSHKRQVRSSSCTQWVPHCVPPVAVVAYPRTSRRHRLRKNHRHVSDRGECNASSEKAHAPRQKRLALAALFVSPGDRAEGGLRVERVVAERLQLQLPDLSQQREISRSSHEMYFASALATSYGRPFRLEVWCAGVTKWNGNVEDFLGRTLLHEAAQMGNEAVTRFLVSQPYIAVDTAVPQTGDTALILAVREDHVNVVKLLIEEGNADPLIANFAGDTPLHVALMRRRAALVGILCGRLRALQVPLSVLDDATMQNNLGFTPAALFRSYSPSLSDLCRDGANLRAVKALVHHYLFSPEELTARDALLGQSILHAAAAGSSLDVLRYVTDELKLGAIVSSSDNAHRGLLLDFRQQTPLHVAAASGEPTCVQYLLTKLPASCLAHRDINGDTPLLVAMKKHSWRVVELLLAQSPPGTLAAVSQDRNGLSALHFACGLGMTRVASVLLRSHGAVAAQSSLIATDSPLSNSVLPLNIDARWGPHGENGKLVHRGLLRGRLRRLERRERERHQRQQRDTAAATKTAQPHLAEINRSRLSEDFDLFDLVRAAKQYVYGGGRRGYTPLRCAILHAVSRGGRATGIPADLLRLLCEHGALSEQSLEDTRDLLFYLRTHHSDARAEPLLSWVIEHYPEAVAGLRRDNVLLCRFCVLRDAVGVRWCVEQQLCDINSRVANPLVACAAIGNASAAAFLIQCAGADVNILSGCDSALAVALAGGHEEAIRVLIHHGASVSSSNSSWTALQQAASGNLENIVRGLLGLRALNLLDVSRVLLSTLQGLLYASSNRRATQLRLAFYLARAYDPLASEVHPTELLHLSAAVRCFDVVSVVAERLSALPSALWAELLASTPPPPFSRPTTLIEPTVAPLTIKAPRLLPNPATGQGGLCRPPKPFQRLVVPHMRQAVGKMLLHRVKVRDVYSYVAEAGLVDLAESLRYGLHLPPWPLCDLRGWTVTDYVLMHRSRIQAPLLAMFLADGIAPTLRHGWGALRPNIGIGALITAVHSSQWLHARKAAPAAQAPWQVSDSVVAPGKLECGSSSSLSVAQELVANTLACLIEVSDEGCSFSEGSDTSMVRIILDAYVRSHYLTDFRQVPCLWLGRVVVACAARGRIDVLRLLKDCYRVDLSQAWCDLTSPSPTTSVSPHVCSSPLITAVQHRRVDVLAYLLEAGCTVRERSCPTPDMAASIPLKNIQTRRISALSLAAWKREYVLLRLLLAASPPWCRDGGEELVRDDAEDALQGLVMAARYDMSREEEATVADCVRALATAGYPLRFEGTVRAAVSKDLVLVAQTLVECYGSAALLADVQVPSDCNETGRGKLAFPRRRGRLSALAHFSAIARLVPTLRALLIEQTEDEFHLPSWRPTEFAARIQSLNRKGGRFGDEWTRTAVDYALSRGCSDGVVLLLALGLTGRGVSPMRPSLHRSLAGCHARKSPTKLCLHLRATLQHWNRRCSRFQSYTVLHSAAELGFGDVVKAITAEMMGLHLPMSLNTDNGVVSVLAGTGTRATVTAPSLYALAATHVDGWEWLPCFEHAALVLDPRALYLAPGDIFALIFSGFGISQVVDQVCRRAAQHKLLGDVFSVLDSAEDVPEKDAVDDVGASGMPNDAAVSSLSTRGCAVSTLFVAQQLQMKPSAFFLAGGTFVLTHMTALTCAIAAGSLEWVQYLRVHGPPLAYHRATAARVVNAAARRTVEKRHTTGQCAAAPSGGQNHSWKPRDPPSRRPRHRQHQCEKGIYGDAGTKLVRVSRDFCRMNALTLCMVILASSHLSHDKDGEVQTYDEILTCLLSWPAATPRKETVNMMAIVAAALRRWSTLLVIMEQADRLYAPEMRTGERHHGVSSTSPPRYFFPLLPEEIPAVLAHVIGNARHVMHIVSRYAPNDVLVEVARHCQRTDVESTTDAMGCTSVYHALRHRRPFAFETFVALRVPMNQPCCTRQAQTPLMVAAACGCTEAVTMLLKPHRVNQQDREGRTALMLAAARGHCATVEVLLAANSDVSVHDACGRTAVMLAAMNGHDDLAVQLAQNFCRAGDLVSAQTSVLHCAAIGCSWRTAAAALKVAAPPSVELMGSSTKVPALLAVHEDIDGHTPLYLAHAFGSARVLHELLRVLFNCHSEAAASQELLARLDAYGSGSVEKRLMLCDSTLDRHGWLSGVLEVNAALVAKVSQAYARSPAALDLSPGEMPYRAVMPSLRDATSVMRWCVQTGNLVGLRVMADYNVADDCGALHLAAAKGFLDVVELLVQLKMSEPSTPDPQTGRYAFEWAALYQHTECAAYLLSRTSLNYETVLGLEAEAGAKDDAAGLQQGRSSGITVGNSTSGDSHPSEPSTLPLLHLMAGQCGGLLLVRFTEQVLNTAIPAYVNVSARKDSCENAEEEQRGVETMSLVLCRALQRPAGRSQLTPLEYAIAVGDPAAVLRTTQVLQRLQSIADALTPMQMRYGPSIAARKQPSTSLSAEGNTKEGTDGAVSLAPVAQEKPIGRAACVTKSFLEWVPTLSPPVRAILFDVFGLYEVANVAGFEAANLTDALSQDAASFHRDSRAAASNEGIAASSMRRITFADVRHLGIHMLMQNDYCAENLHDFFSPDHEREVLRMLLRNFPHKIRYEPTSYRECSLAQQTELLRWLGTSLISSSYEAVPLRCGSTLSWAAGPHHKGQQKLSNISSIEIRIVRHRSEEYAKYTDGTLSHSLYVSTAQHALRVPDVLAVLPEVLHSQREAWKAALMALTTRATRLLQRAVHPVLRTSSVTVQWDLLTLTKNTTMNAAATHIDRCDAAFRCVCGALHMLMDWVRGPLHSLLAGVTAADLAAVVAGARQGSTSSFNVVFQCVSEEGRSVVRFPSAPNPASFTFGSGAYPPCNLDFDEFTHTDVAYACRTTIGRAVAADVALVRVHQTRDRFLREVRVSLANPRGVTPLPTILAQPTEDKDREGAITGRGSAPPGESAVAKVVSEVSDSHAAGPARLLSFKLELEDTTLDVLPVPELERLLLDETISAIDAVVSPQPKPFASSSHSVTKVYDAFHSAALVSAALVRRLSSVLVLFSTRREAMVRLTGGKLMLCFTANEIPSRSDIIAELTRAIVQEECELYRQRLLEVHEMMAQRLCAYLPQARLTVDVAAMERLVVDEAHRLSMLRLLLHQQSEWVLQRLVEGVSIGWDTALGTAVRRHVRQVTLTLDPGLYGSCYLSPNGIFVYYCPLLCLERLPPGSHSPFTLSTWQMLSAQHIASLLIMQIAVREPEVLQLVDLKRSVACWTTARAISSRVVPGAPVVVKVQTRNLVNRPLHRGDGEPLRLMGAMVRPHVEYGGKGSYTLRFKAPLRAGNYRVFILMQGQPVARSPLTYTVHPGGVDLRQTQACVSFDAVLIDHPFTVHLHLRDVAGNRLRTAPEKLSVVSSSLKSVLQLEGWEWEAPGTVAVALRVLPSVSRMTMLNISLELACQSTAAAHTAAATASVMLPPLTCVDGETFLQAQRVRRGFTSQNGSPVTQLTNSLYPRAPSTAQQATQQSVNLYFRRGVRRAARKRLAREAATLAGALTFHYPRDAGQSGSTTNGSARVAPAPAGVATRSKAIA